MVAKEDRRKESELKDQYKSSSTYRVIIGARVDCVPECNHNLKVLLDALELPRLHKDFRIVCDLKVVDILLGIQSCSAIHSCPYCEGYKVNKLGIKTNQKGLWVKGNPRTMNSLMNSYENWMIIINSYRNLLKKYFNVEFPPI